MKLNDVLRPLSDAVEIQAAVAGVVMNDFGADRCYYCEIEDDRAVIRRDASRDGLPSVAGVYPLDDFPFFRAMMNDGVPLVVDDANTTDLMDGELKQLCIQMKILSVYQCAGSQRRSVCRELLHHTKRGEGLGGL